MNNNVPPLLILKNRAKMYSPVETVISRAYYLIDLIDEYLLIKGLSNNVYLLLKILKLIADSTVKKLIALKEEFLSSSDYREREKIQKTVRNLSRRLSALYGNLQFVSAAKPERNPKGIISALEKEAEYYCKCVVIIVSQWEFKYEYYSLLNSIKKLIAGEEKIKKDIFELIKIEKKEKVVEGFDCEDIALLLFPGLERDNILLHVWLGHEIGHHIIQREKLLPNIQGLNLKYNGDLFNQLLEIRKKEIVKEDWAKFALNTELEKRAIGWIEELMADIIATRIMGFAFLPASENWLTSFQHMKKLYGVYPPIEERIKYIKDECLELGYFEFFRIIGQNPKYKEKECAIKLCEEFSKYEQTNYKGDREDGSEETLGNDRIICKLMQNAIREPIETIRKKIRNIIPKNNEGNNREVCKAFELEENIFEQIESLIRLIPPAQGELKEEQEISREIDIRNILNMGWITLLFYDASEEYIKSIRKRVGGNAEGDENKTKDKDILQLVLRAMELSDIQKKYFDKYIKKNGILPKLPKLKNGNQNNFNNGVLSKEEMWKFIYKNQLYITPLLNPKQIGEGSCDVRLGNTFIVGKTGEFLGLDLRKSWSIKEQKIEKEKFEKELKRYQSLVRLEYGEEFVLHPNQFALGSTLEYIALPNNICAYVIGRSSWGRLGLIIATATFVAPGFRGSITLELVNLGNVPIVIYPTLRIAQLVFHKTSLAEEGYAGKYDIAIGPMFSEIHKDDDWNYIFP